MGEMHSYILHLKGGRQMTGEGEPKRTGEIQ